MKNNLIFLPIRLYVWIKKKTLRIQLIITVDKYILNQELHNKCEIIVY